MRFVVAGVLVGTVGCGWSQPTVVYKGITDQAMRVEERALPDRPDKEQLTDLQNATYPVAKGSVAPVDGIVMTADKAARVLKLKIAYDEMRAFYDADRKVFSQNRLIYEERIQQANAEIARLTPSWWDRYGFQVGMVVGIIGTAGLTAGLYQIATATK